MNQIPNYDFHAVFLYIVNHFNISNPDIALHSSNKPRQDIHVFEW